MFGGLETLATALGIKAPALDPTVPKECAPSLQAHELPQPQQTKQKQLNASPPRALKTGKPLSATDDPGAVGTRTSPVRGRVDPSLLGWRMPTALAPGAAEVARGSKRGGGLVAAADREEAASAFGLDLSPRLRPRTLSTSPPRRGAAPSARTGIATRLASSPSFTSSVGPPMALPMAERPTTGGHTAHTNGNGGPSNAEETPAGVAVPVGGMADARVLAAEGSATREREGNAVPLSMAEHAATGHAATCDARASTGDATADAKACEPQPWHVPAGLTHAADANAVVAEVRGVTGRAGKRVAAAPDPLAGVTTATFATSAASAPSSAASAA
jgi:hypothetical protein